jgi:hypothetical protein
MIKQDKAIRIGDLWLNERMGNSIRPATIMIGIWNEPAMAELDIEQLKQLRKYATDKIIKLTNNKTK